MADIKPIRYVRNSGNTVGFSELQSGETIAWSDVNHPTFANVAISGSYNDLIDTPAIVTPGGSNTQVQYNNNGVFAGITGLTTDGANITIGNTTTITSQNRTDRTDQSWNTGSTGNIGTIRFGNTTDNTYDAFSNLRNSKVRIDQVLDTGGTTFTTGLRRVAISSSSALKNTTGNIALGSQDRFYGAAGQAYLDNGGFTNSGGGFSSFAGGVFNAYVKNGTTPYATGLNSGVVADASGKINTAICSLSAFNLQNNGSVVTGANFVPQWAYSGSAPTTSTSNSYAYYMGTPVGTTDTILGVNGSPNPSYQTGIPYFLYCNNTRAYSKIGSIAQADEVYTTVTGPATTDVLSLSLSTMNAYQVNLQSSANISELTFTGYNTSRLTSATLIFKQSSSGYSYVYWPTGTKFAGSIKDIDLNPDSVTMVSVLIHRGVYYVTIGLYSV